MEERLRNVNIKIRLPKPPKTIKQNTIMYSVLFILLFFLSAIGDVEVPGPLQFLAKHYDEALTLLLVMYVFFHIKYIERKKNRLFIGQICLLTIGMLSTIFFHYQGMLISIVDAVLLVSRFLIAYYSAYIFLKIHKKNVSQYILNITKIITIFLFVFSLHEIFFDPFLPTSDYRYFMYGLQLFFPHATYMAAAAATLLIYFGYMHNKGKKVFIYMIMSTLLVCFTLRMKAVGFSVIYWLFYVQTFYFKKRHYYFTALICIVVVLFVAYDALMTNFLTEGRFMPRMIMLQDGISLMISHFPLGTGFASYGSAMAASNYSPLYTKLGYVANRGMSPTDTSFLTDVFWPTVFAQFGLIGTGVFIFILITLIKIAIRVLKKDKARGFSMVMIMSYYLITSTAESGFFNPTALLMFLMFGALETERDLSSRFK